MTKLEYLKDRYLAEGEPEWYLDVRVPFNYKADKFKDMSLIDFIDYVKQAEENQA